LQFQRENSDRLAALDGLRGLAAMAVALLHGSTVFNLSWSPIHAYLAVDFFFLLSGYVIARAFEKRLRQGWMVGFLRRRFIRLYPIIVVGSLIGFLELTTQSVRAHTLSISQAILDLVCSLLVIPTPPLISHHWRLYPVDAPLWSLFFEITVNVVYAAIAAYLYDRRLWLLVLVAGVALGCAIISFEGADFGLIHFKIAGLRVLFSFFLGVALYRAMDSKPDQRSAPFIVTLLNMGVLALILLAPAAPGWTYDLMAIFVVFPAVLVAALRANPGGERWQSGCRIAGLLSYPLYAIHLPLFLIARGNLFEEPDQIGRSLAFAMSLTAVLLLSWLLARFFDQPVRRLVSQLTSRVEYGPVSP
jgi:peptidoglycan/LPS O-acetylase OafA/YrhL